MKSLSGGGTEKVLLTMLRNIDYSLFEVELLLLYNEGVYMEDVPKEVKRRYVYSKSLSFREKFDYFLFRKFGTYQGYKQIMRYRVPQYYDTIISFMEGYTLRFHSYIADRADKNISWVHMDLLTHHYTVGRLFTEDLEKQAYAMMDKIVFVSNNAKSQFELLYPENKVEKKVILNPIEKDLIVQYRKKYKKYLGDRCFNIVSVGRLSGEKGFDRLIRLAKRLKEDGYKFHINLIGEGALRERLEKLIVDNSVEENVSLLGFINPPYELMSNSDLFISTSVSEGFSLVVAEAFCLGLPIVATKTAGPLELIENNKYGLLTEHDDESIYQAVKKMIDDDSAREHYHKMSFQRAEKININFIIDQVHNIL